LTSSDTHIAVNPNASVHATDGQTTSHEIVGELDVSIIIVNYNVKEFLKQVLNSIEKATQNLKVETIVVDNDSADGSVEMVRQFFPDVKLYANKENLGFSKANNLGICDAKGKYLFILNPDTILQEDSLVTLIQFLEDNPDAGAVGPRIMNPDGSFARESRRSFPSPSVAFYRIFGLGRLFPKSKIFGRYNLSYIPNDQVCEVDALSGSCMMIRKDALLHAFGKEAEFGDRPSSSAREKFENGGGGGLFDESFFMYGEDLDWCFRIKAAGWKIFYTPETQIIHYKGESTKRGELRYVKLFYGAMIQFVDKHFEGRHSKIFAAIVSLGIFVRAGQSIVARALQRLKIPFVEFLLATLSIVLVAGLRSLPVTFSFPRYFYYLVAPLFALSIVLSIAAINGYSIIGRKKTGSAFVGVGIAFLFITSLSFFAKGIAFSRIVALFGFSLAGVVIAASRWIRSELNDRNIGKRQAVMIGGRAEALRLDNMLRSNPDPPFDLLGFVDVNQENQASSLSVQTLPRLGDLSQLRDIVRMRYIDDIVFSADDVSNQKILESMTEVGDLPVDCKILSSGAEHVIGKSFIGTVEPFEEIIGAEERVAEPRNQFLRRMIDIPVGLIAGILHLLLFPLRLLSGKESLFNRMGRISRRSFDLIFGKLTFVGVDEDENISLPEAWGLGGGVIPIVPLDRGLNEEDRKSAYWKYVETQSFALDMRIMWDRIRRRNNRQI